MNRLFCICLIFLGVLSFKIFAQEKAIICDSDGYTNIREGRTADSRVVGEILDKEIFLYWEEQNENWLKVSIYKGDISREFDNLKSVKGFVHRSRIQAIKTLDEKLKRTLFNWIFGQEIQLYKSYKSIRYSESKESIHAGNRWHFHHEFEFDVVLDEFIDFLCKTKDLELFKVYNEILSLEEGSADETPLWAFGEVYICHPEWVIKNFDRSLLNELEWGFVNAIYQKEEIQIDLAKKVLNEYRLSIGLEESNYNEYY